MARTWQLSALETADEAYERCGIDATTLSAYQYDQALRSLNLLQAEWSARRPLLWSVVERTIELDQGQRTVLTESGGTADSRRLPEGLMDIVALAIRYPDSETDVQLESMAYDTYTNLPSKDLEGIPTSYVYERSIDPKLHLWYAPGADGYRLYGWFQVRPQDADSYLGNPDVAYRYYEAMCAGLAAKLAVKVAPDRLAFLKPLYDEALMAAEQADDQRTGIDIACGEVF